METKDIKIPDTNASKYIKIGLLVLVIMFGVVGFWAYTAKLDTGVACSGQVIVESKKKTIQSLTGGKIKKFYVKDGDEVKKGDKLIEFDDTKAKSQLESLLVNYYEYIAQKDRLLAIINEKDNIEFSKELNDLDTKEKEKLINRQIDIFKHQKEFLSKQQNSLTHKIKALKENIKALEDNINKKGVLLNSYKKEMQEQKVLFSKGLVDKNRYIDAKRRVTALESEILDAKSQVQKSKIEIENAKNDYQLTREKFFTEQNSNLSQIETKLDEMKAKMKDLKNILNNMVLYSPVDGIVMNMAYHTIGAIVPPAKPIMDIVPKDADLIIEARLKPQFIEYVKVGEKALLSFPAFAMDNQFGKKIYGKVIFISADTTTDRNERPFYIIRLKVTKEGKKILEEEKLKLLAGMPASATVIAGNQTMFEYLVKPIIKMAEKAFLEK